MRLGRSRGHVTIYLNISFLSPPPALRFFVFPHHPRVRRLAPIPQATLTPAAQAQEEVVQEAALENQIIVIVNGAVRMIGELPWQA